MHSYELARVIDYERQQDNERRIRMLVGRSDRPPKRSIRQAIGRVLIRIGSQLDSDGPVQIGRQWPADLRETQN